jgi:diguanylate cyclase (GGDEF)-like protein
VSGSAVEPGRLRSLRREWSRAFTILLALLLVSAAATIGGVRQVVGQVENTAHQLQVESATVNVLRTALVAHEQIGHRLLSAEAVDRAAYVRQQDHLTSLFDNAAKVFPATNGLRDAVIQARESWQSGLMTYGLWGLQVRSLRGNHASDNPTYGAASDSTAAQLDGLQSPSLAAMQSGLAHGANLERMLIIALASLFALALAVTVYFRRRMVTDLMRPVASIHQVVLKVQAGEYHHRLAVIRRDELGALTQAFNAMADALHASHETLTVRATHDWLTGLPNRASLTERLASSFASGTDRRAWRESVLFIDVDDFKDVNDTLGHHGGDALLVELAARLRSCVRTHDLVARLGGDEFAIVVDEDGSFGAVQLAERIMVAMTEPFTVNGARLFVSVSIGVALKQPESRDAAELLRCADFAMYMAKGAGKGRYQLYDAEVHDELIQRANLKTSLAAAVPCAQLRLDYQPVVDLGTGEVTGVEALVRWQHPTLGLLPPSEFIALAEESGDIDDIGCWVLETAAREVASWRAGMTHCADLWVSVNLSARQLGNPASVAAIQRILSDPEIEADHVILEVTETALAAGIPDATASLDMLKRSGVRIAIDDFGTGFSSLSTLTSLPVDILKIDRSFVSGHSPASLSAPMLEGILGLAEKLSLVVIAEGIEDSEQLELLHTLGCPQGQGYLMARPTAAHAIQSLLASGGLIHLNHPVPAVLDPTSVRSRGTSRQDPS